MRKKKINKTENLRKMNVAVKVGGIFLGCFLITILFFSSELSPFLSTYMASSATGYTNSWSSDINRIHSDQMRNMQAAHQSTQEAIRRQSDWSELGKTAASGSSNASYDNYYSQRVTKYCPDASKNRDEKKCVAACNGLSYLHNLCVGKTKDKKANITLTAKQQQGCNNICNRDSKGFNEKKCNELCAGQFSKYNVLVNKPKQLTKEEDDKQSEIQDEQVEAVNSIENENAVEKDNIEDYLTESNDVLAKSSQISQLSQEKSFLKKTKIFLIGVDQEELNNVVDQIGTLQQEKLKLQELLNNSLEQTEKERILAQINLMVEEEEKLQGYLGVSKNKFSLFGWTNSLF